jgi:hypothetical protein
MMVSSREPSEMAVPVRSERLARASLWGAYRSYPVDCMEKSNWRMAYLWFLLNNINSVMAMESFYQ